MIRVKDLLVSFNGFVAVDKISFEVGSGQVVGILGSNGAGKSTTMKALAGIIRPSSGDIFVNNIRLTSIREEEEAKQRVGYCPDVGGLIVGATPREHIQLLLSLHGRENDYDLGLFLVDKIGLTEFLDTPVGGFSHGMSRRLSVILAVLASRDVLILDEPFDGVDPLGVDAIEQIIHEAKRSGLAVIVCTHLQSILTRVVDDLVIMKKGQVIDRLPAAELMGAEGEAKYKQLLLASGATDEAIISTDYDSDNTVLEDVVAILGATQTPPSEIIAESVTVTAVTDVKPLEADEKVSNVVVNQDFIQTEVIEVVSSSITKDSSQKIDTAVLGKIEDVISEEDTNK